MQTSIREYVFNFQLLAPVFIEKGSDYLQIVNFGGLSVIVIIFWGVGVHFG